MSKVCHHLCRTHLRVKLWAIMFSLCHVVHVHVGKSDFCACTAALSYNWYSYLTMATVTGSITNPTAQEIPEKLHQPGNYLLPMQHIWTKESSNPKGCDMIFNYVVLWFNNTHGQTVFRLCNHNHITFVVNENPMFHFTLIYT